MRVTVPSKVRLGYARRRSAVRCPTRTVDELHPDEGVPAHATVNRLLQDRDLFTRLHAPDCCRCCRSLFDV